MSVLKSVNLVVQKDSPFFDTGIVLEPGQRLRLQAAGSIYYWKARFYAYPEGVYSRDNQPHPDSGPEETLTEAQINLIADYRLSDVKPFSIGIWIGNTFVAPTSGGLQGARDITIFENQHSGGKVFCGLNRYGDYPMRASGQMFVTLDQIQPDGSVPDSPIQMGQVSPIRMVPSALLFEKNKKSQTTAWFWFIQPLYGPAEAYTNWDQPIDCPAYENEFGLDGNYTPAMTYAPRHGVDLTAIPASIRLGIKAPDVRVIRLERNKLLKGYYEGAYVEIFENVVDGDKSERYLALVGELGNSQIEDDVTTIELTPLEEIANRMIGGKIIPVCDVGRLTFGAFETGHYGDIATLTPAQLAGFKRSGETLGRGRCYNITKKDGIDIENWTRGAIVNGVLSTAKMTISALTIGAYDGFETDFPGSHGRLIGVTGNNAQVVRDIGTFDGNTGTITLRRSVPFTPEVGDTFLIEAGCDKTPEMCRFWQNLHNSRFFENVPGRQAVRRRWGVDR